MEEPERNYKGSLLKPCRFQRGTTQENEEKGSREEPWQEHTEPCRNHTGTTIYEKKNIQEPHGRHKEIIQELDRNQARIRREPWKRHTGSREEPWRNWRHQRGSVCSWGWECVLICSVCDDMSNNTPNCSNISYCVDKYWMSVPHRGFINNAEVDMSRTRPLKQISHTLECKMFMGSKQTVVTL